MQTQNNIEDLKPFTKWVGGKSTSVKHLLELVPSHIDTYVEPFVGSGAMFFSLNFDKAIINDTNQELICTYETIKDNVYELEMFLSTLVYDKGLYEKIRAWDREPKFLQRPKIERASRLIYLMKTCFNGLYRVSSKNFFNTPFGNIKNPNICDSKTLRACSKYLNNKQVSIFNKDYKELLDIIPDNSFVYLDPPYFPLSKTSNFTSYQSGKFKDTEQYRLYEFCMALHERGIKFMQSNSSAPDVYELYKNFNIGEVNVSRRINSNKDKRNAVIELAITNYDKDSEELIHL